MLELKSHFTTNQISSNPLANPIRKPQTTVTTFFKFRPTQTHNVSHFKLKTRRSHPRGFKALPSDESQGNESGYEFPRLDLRWKEVVFDPDRDNVVAVGLSGMLAWAGVHVLWHLLVVIMAIMIAAVKYTFVGVLLIFVVITLL